MGEEKRLESRTDSVGNVVINVPATEGYENAPGIIFQGHLDMVCEKPPGSTHDFSKDPIALVYDGDWLKADNTTLGADNGIGIALCLAIATEEAAGHPPLELLFTVEEETGLRGAESLQPGFIEGSVLINIDSEEEGVFTVGSAGGRMLLIECGTIGSKYPGMDMISLGPTIKNPHSPDEKLHIPSIGKIRDFLVSIIGSF